MKPDDFQLLSGLLKERSGLVLTVDKAYLLESRLVPLARKQGMRGLEDLVHAIRTTREERLINVVTEAMTTNESLFFRDSSPFDQLKATLLPSLQKARVNTRRLRIWSAACSTGQEPYSIAMVLKDAGALLAGWRVDLIGTDLSTEVLEKAKAGIYSQFEVQRGLPIAMLVKYFTKANDMWQAKPDLRGMVQYRQHNLLNDLSILGTFDIVFCRNVLIYFDQATKAMILERVARLLAPDGYLILGGAETVLGITGRYAPVPNMRGIYAIVPERKH
ncbi:MAG: CheR family methyltransferase [Alphaproteobacteria bacterium]